jgi:hypothetical protein
MMSMSDHQKKVLINGVIEKLADQGQSRLSELDYLDYNKSSEIIDVLIALIAEPYISANPDQMSFVEIDDETNWEGSL